MKITRFHVLNMVAEPGQGSKENRPSQGTAHRGTCCLWWIFILTTPFSGKLLSYVSAFWGTFMVVTFILATCFRFATTLFSFPEKCPGHHRLPSLFR